MTRNHYNSNYVLNFGPQHPAAHGVLRLIMELDGEMIVSLDPHIGFLHRGTEKLIENKSYLQSIPYFDRLDYVSMMSQEHAFVIAMESLLNIKLNKYALYSRILMDEVTRILNHIMCITTHALDVGALTPFLWGFEEREYLMNLYEMVSGARMHASYYRIGGVNQKIPDIFLEKIYEFLIKFQSYIDLLDDLLTNNTIWISRLKNIGVFSKKQGLDFAFSGPLIRSAGIPWDIRKVQPYCLYNNLDFNIPVSAYGDSYSRYNIRLLEMKESISLINQTINILSNIETHYNILEIADLDYSKKTMENLIYVFKEKTYGINAPKLSLYSSIEAPKGETGLYIVGNNSSNLYRCHVKSPGFLHLQGLNTISKNLLIADVVTNIGSIDIVFGEIDR